MPESVLAMAKDLALAQIQAGQVTLDDMTSVLNSAYETLEQLSATELSGSAAPASKNPTNWKKSITKHAVTCLECGATFRMLSTRHLRHHDLDSRTYRQKHGIPRTQSLSARDVQARRQAIVQLVKPWEKSPTNLNTPEKTAAKAQPATPKKTAKKATRKQRKNAQPA